MPAKKKPTNKKTSSGNTFKCGKCGKSKKKSEGSFIWGGTTFCCNKCCKKGGKKPKEACEFC